MSERTAEAATTVEEDGIRVEKSFTDDEFPVPAMTYELSSTREEAARVRIVDTIPESFPMDRIGFHPDYESDNWTAYKDHRVEFERVLEPGERVETVFGIRSDEPDVDGFLGTPMVEHVPVGEEIADVLGTDGTDAVREVLSGERATLPGMERTDASSGTDPIEEPTGTFPEPRETGTETTAAVTPRGTASEPPIGSEAKSGEDAGSTGSAETAEHEEATEAGAEAPEVASGEAGDEEPTTKDDERGTGIAAAMAAEIRAGEVDDADLDVLRSELDVTVPRSVDVRISRLQSSVADIEAYADALAEFIDGEGTVQEILEDLRSRVDEVGSGMAALEERVDGADGERSALADDLDEVEESVVSVEETVARVERSTADVEAEIGAVREEVAEVEGSVAKVTEDVTDLEADVTGLDEAVEDVGDDIGTLYEGLDDVDAATTETDARVDGVEDRLDRFDSEFDDLWDDLAEVDTRLTDIEDDLGGDLGDVESDIADIHDHLEELEAFRKRLNEAFGP